ncbi:MAG TPA: lysophospholipid acyltransferase family protein [Anaerolineales bacterium]|nr:lysophospholipid acyltransferase family protein [Anaerolineales bacterium]
MKPYTVPIANRIARWIFRPVFRLVFHLLSEIKIIGLENVPGSGAYLIAINHVSTYEPPFVLAFWPTAPEGAGAIEIWERPGQAILVRIYHGIPIHRGEFDRLALESIINVLNSGHPLLIAPEGGRTHDLGMRRALPGVAYLVEKTGVPVVPVGVVGATDDFFARALRFKRPRLEMRIGQPFHLPAVEGRGAERREALQANADQIMQAIAALVPSEYHGVYRDPGALT